MSNYIQAEAFGPKDSLPTGNTEKIIKGSEFDTEFGLIQASIATKADTNSPTLTGVPLAPTASAGTNTTQVATTAFVTAGINALGTMSTQNANAVAITGGTINGTSLATYNGNGNRTVSASAPTGGSDGDIWYQI